MYVGSTLMSIVSYGFSANRLGSQILWMEMSGNLFTVSF